jgi:hypothetical protein
MCEGAMVINSCPILISFALTSPIVVNRRESGAKHLPLNDGGAKKLGGKNGGAKKLGGKNGGAKKLGGKNGGAK